MKRLIPNNLTFAFWNCCGGVQNKMNRVLHILDSIKPTILFISEAEFLDVHTWVYHENYDTHTTKTQKYDKCRLIAFVKKDSDFRASKKSIGDDVEVLLFESSLCVVGGVYRPFKMVNGNTSKSYL